MQSDLCVRQVHKHHCLAGIVGVVAVVVAVLVNAAVRGGVVRVIGVVSVVVVVVCRVAPHEASCCCCSTGQSATLPVPVQHLQHQTPDNTPATGARSCQSARQTSGTIPDHMRMACFASSGYGVQSDGSDASSFYCRGGGASACCGDGCGCERSAG